MPLINYGKIRQASDQNRSCTDQTVTICIIIEGNVEINMKLYIGFVDY